MNWKHALQDFLHYSKIERGLSENTILNYRSDIIKLERYLVEFEIKSSPLTISTNQIQQFIYEVSKILEPSSQSRIISGLKSFFDYLVFEEYRTDSPMDLIESPKLTRKLPDTLSIIEIDNLIAAIDLSHSQGERNRVIIETIYSCGLRVSELVHLKISDLFFKDEVIRVIGKGNKQRFIPINSNTQQYIVDYIENNRIKITPHKEFEDTVFLNRRGKQLTRQMIFIILKDLATNINLPKKISPHTLRHSFATHLLENGANLRAIQQMLGHESITTTEIYVHLDKSYLKKVMHAFHPRK